MMGGALAHEFMVLTDVGEDTVMRCEACEYAANRQIAEFKKPERPPEPARPQEKVATPNVTTIAALTDFLGISAAQTAKVVFLVATVGSGEDAREQFVFAVVRGDMALNETKLANAVKARDLRPATDTEIRAVGAEPGYGSPIGVHDALIVVDDAIPASPNLVAGANEPGFHLRNVNYPRDFKADVVVDIAAAEAGDACPRCGAALRADRAVEVGNIFKLGTRYTEALECTFTDEDGSEQPVVMGSYGIGVGRALACVAETHHDVDGLIWPISVAPYQVHLVVLFRERTDKTVEVAEDLYLSLTAAGIEVLYDDRDASPGVKFNDADLIGVPLRLTVGSRSLREGGVELKRREQDERALVPLDEVEARLRAEIEALHAELDTRVVNVPFHS
jgi:prolyl-tRNA synthetase